MAESTTGRLGRRLGRILLLLPYAIQHPGVTVAELARKFDVDKRDLLDDLQLVFMCGLPGYGPGDLIDVDLDEDRVYVRMADYFAAPLRLHPPRRLLSTPVPLTLGRATRDGGSRSAQECLSEAPPGTRRSAGDGDRPPTITVALEPAIEEIMLSVRGAIADRKQIALEYFSASRGGLSERTVEPWGLDRRSGALVSGRVRSPQRRGAHVQARPHEVGAGAGRACRRSRSPSIPRPTGAHGIRHEGEPTISFEISAGTRPLVRRLLPGYDRNGARQRVDGDRDGGGLVALGSDSRVATRRRSAGTCGRPR